MATAVIIAGQARSFDRVWKNQYWTVLRHVPDPFFFISVEDDVDAAKMDLLKERFGPERIFMEKVVQPSMPAKFARAETLDHGAYGASAPPIGIWRQLWALNRGWAFYESCERKGIPGKDKFDAFLRIRPDLHFHWFKWPRRVFPRMCLSPWWSRWGGICDRVAVLGPEAAPVYFQAFQKLDEMLDAGAPFHPESLMAEALERGGVVSSTNLGAWFMTVRKDGSAIPPDPQMPDIADYIRHG